MKMARNNPRRFLRRWAREIGFFYSFNVQIEGLADHKAWPEPRKFNNHRPRRERLSVSPSRMQG